MIFSSPLKIMSLTFELYRDRIVEVLKNAGVPSMFYSALATDPRLKELIPGALMMLKGKFKTFPTKEELIAFLEELIGQFTKILNGEEVSEIYDWTVAYIEQNKLW